MAIIHPGYVGLFGRIPRLLDPIVAPSLPTIVDVPSPRIRFQRTDGSVERPSAQRPHPYYRCAPNDSADGEINFTSEVSIGLLQEEKTSIQLTLGAKRSPFILNGADFSASSWAHAVRVIFGNQDRVAVSGLLSMVADGVGGTLNGELAAEFITQYVAAACSFDYSLRVAVLLAHGALRDYALDLYNLHDDDHMSPCAVFLASQIEVIDGRKDLRVVSVGDVEGVILTRVDGYWELLHQLGGHGVDGVPEDMLGRRDGGFPLVIHETVFNSLPANFTQILATDGLSKLFNWIDEEGRLQIDWRSIVHLMEQAGWVTAAEIQRGIQAEARVRQKLAIRAAIAEQSPIRLTRKLYEETYREIKETPPAGPWAYKGYWIDKDGSISEEPNAPVFAEWSLDDVGLLVRETNSLTP